MPAATTLVGPGETARPVPNLDAPHSLEREVHRRLQAQPGLEIKSLVVRRTPNGVCLEGRIEMPDGNVDLRQLMIGVPGLNELINHLVVCSPGPGHEVAPPRRG
ncbi:MAG: hypothetical protein SH850_17750 [Planctomycetaceae bacterium]|nr:hypothetical protein [Planctomycetaceae bacterium]